MPWQALSTSAVIFGRSIGRVIPPSVTLSVCWVGRAACCAYRCRKERRGCALADREHGVAGARAALAQQRDTVEEVLEIGEEPLDRAAQSVAFVLQSQLGDQTHVALAHRDEAFAPRGVAVGGAAREVDELVGDVVQRRHHDHRP